MKSVFIPALIVFAVFQANQDGIRANDQTTLDSVSAEQPSQDGFEFSRRKDKTPSEELNYDLKSSLGDSGIKVLIGVGIFLIALLALTRRKSEKRIPIEAVEILGSIPVGGKQNIQLIRFGQKLVLIELSANGLKPISEITDPAEVNQMLDLIRPRTR